MKPSIVLVGVGRFGKNHLRVLEEMEKQGLCKLYGVVDERAEVLEKVEKSHNIATSPDLADFLKSEVNAVDIVTPADTHFELCRKCLAAGKHVFVEKPLATSYTEATKLVQLARDKKRILGVGHQYRYNPATTKIKALIDNGELGRVYYMLGHYMGFKEPRTDVGALLNFAVHHIDIYDYLLEETPTEVTCSIEYFLGRKDFEDLAILILKYRNAVGIIEGGWLPPGNYRDLMVVGSKKSVTSDLAKQTITLHDIHVEPSGRAFKAVDKGSVNVNMKYEEPLKRELADFVECIETGRDPIANGQAASRVIMIAQKALEAAKQKRSVGIDETK